MPQLSLFKIQTLHLYKLSGINETFKLFTRMQLCIEVIFVVGVAVGKFFYDKNVLSVLISKTQAIYGIFFSGKN